MSEKEDAKKDYSYLHERLDPLGWTPERNVVTLPASAAGDGQEHQYPLFDVDDEGNLLINYYRPTGAKAQFKRANSNVSKDYTAIRFRNPRVRPDGSIERYKSPAGTPTIPWFSPNIIRAFQEKRQVNTIHMTEGVLKCFAGDVQGLHMVGFAGIQNTKDKSTGSLSSDLVHVLKMLKPTEVVWLHDGDCRRLATSWPEDPTTDLYTRPNDFFTSARNMGELLKDYARMIGFKAYYMHVVSDAFPAPPKTEAPKGLDDLILAYPEAKVLEAGHRVTKDAEPVLPPPEKREEIRKAAVAELIADINTFSGGNRFFERRDLDRPEKLRDYFHLRSADTFYAAYQEQIGDKEFVYDGTQYQWDESEKGLKVKKPSIAKRYVRVGTDYFKYIKKRNPHSAQLEEHLVKWSRATIIEDHGKHFCEHIMKLEAFTNYPDHFGYQEIKDNCLNSYARFLHAPDPDAEPPVHTLKFLKHIFGSGTVTVPHPRKTGDDGKPLIIEVKEWELGLDYLKLLLERPTQMLPILCLVSKARGTGKTTFFDLLQVILAANCTYIGARDIEGDFNYHYASKLAIIIDEALVSKREVVEKLKSLSTAKQIMVNNKGVAQYPQAFFGKFLMGSNNVRDFIKTDDDEVRFWVREIPKIRAEDNDTELMDRLVEEIPAFLAHLMKRAMSTEKLFRSWFHPPLLVTEALQEVRRHSAPNAQRQIEGWLKGVFYATRAEEILMTTKDLKVEIFRNNSSVEEKWINQLVEENMGVKRWEKNGKSATRAYSYQRIVEKKSTVDGTTIDVETVSVKVPQRPFVFKREDLIDNATWELVKPDESNGHEPGGRVPAMAGEEEADDLPF